MTATLTGTHHRAAQALLAARGFENLDDHTMVLARIDHEEPYWAHQATHALHAEGITTEITPRLRKAIDEEWTWANYPMHWLTRAEVREVSNAAQSIYDDIRHGRLIIHAHAHDGWTTVAIGTYLDGGTVALHGENHLRSIADRLESPVQALASFQRLHGDAVRPGPAPMTDTERQIAAAVTSLGPQTLANTISPPTTNRPSLTRRPFPSTPPILATMTLSSTSSSPSRATGRSGGPSPTTPRTSSTSHRPCASSSCTKRTPRGRLDHRRL